MKKTYRCILSFNKCKLLHTILIVVVLSLQGVFETAHKGPDNLQFLDKEECVSAII